jgi:hypothetical protein
MSRLCRRRMSLARHQWHGQFAPINQRPAPFLMAKTGPQRKPTKNNIDGRHARISVQFYSAFDSHPSYFFFLLDTPTKLRENQSRCCSSVFALVQPISNTVNGCGLAPSFQTPYTIQCMYICLPTH